ncbi:MAG: SIR2 family protein [Gemmatimonadetes bacterium]|nr:SIR2 family protein [Gemmatimonadota bacterium]
MTHVSTPPLQRHADGDLLLSLDAFVRSIGIRRTAPLSVFLGAGASISSGIPSAQTCIWEWKRSIFLTNNPGLEDQFAEISLPGIRRRIQQWLDAQGHFPPDGSPDEYAFFIQQCFPIPEDRRGYFQNIVRNARPHVGYQLLCHLAEANLIQSVWSTNFDGLVARAAAPFSLIPLEVGLDSQQRVTRPAAPGQLLCVSLHGDYRYDALKNTPEELRTQETALCKALTEETRTAPLVVVGYSGRDRSVMDALHEAYGRAGPTPLFWCGFTDDSPPAHVIALIQHARTHGHQAHYVPTLGFDDLMTRLALHCTDGERRDAARRCIAALAPADPLYRKPFQVPKFASATLIKSNAFRIECPTEVLQFDLKVWPKERVWASLREATDGRPLVAVPFRHVLALGTIEGIRAAFGDNIKGSIERTPVAPEDLRYEDAAVVSLMRQALVRSLAEAAGVPTDGTRSLWRPGVFRTVRRGTETYSVHEAAVIFLRNIGGFQYLIIMPSLKVFDQTQVEPPLEVANAIKLEILGYQHNKPFNKAVNAWRATLFPQGQTAVFSFPGNSGSTFQFRVRRSPVFATIGLPSRTRAVSVPQKMQPLIQHRGMQLVEPSLLFSNREGTASAKDAHPIRGMLTHRPYDYPLTSRGLSSSLRIGVVCPSPEARSLHAYLQSIHRKLAPSSKERDYLLDYPGFQTAYGLPVELPTPGSVDWINCPEPSTRQPNPGALDAARLINRSIETLHASRVPDVVLIYIPDRWQPFRGYNTESESFDLHNFVKAFCVQRGIATQFLNQDTLSDAYQCRVWWWLSLALYVKGMRTPWLLESLADDTAFVGLGFSIDASARRGDHVVLGCSHIYNARGEGLQYRLSKIENPIIRRGNPFMSEDDARRVGDTIRQLFFDARKTLPNRVVLHKRTPFVKAEREGLRDGLSGVEHLDMLEIQIDHALRYVASVHRPNGVPDEDNYPVRRGTAMRLDDYSALLWVHGATAALDPRLTYFQGKRRIPAPLVIRRHAGQTPLQQLSAEILGLSKMNWNTFDLYTKLPSTLGSSGEIAKIGALLQRFGATSYDYRLFI